MSKHVFLSFVVEDLSSANLFRGQAKNDNSLLEFADFSVRTPYNSTDATYIRSRITERIAATSVTICLIGMTTASSAWVDWEIRKSSELGKRVIGVTLPSPFPSKIPVALTTVGASIMRWNISDIVRAIG